MTTILIKKKDTAGAPTAGDLTNAAGGTEIAVNTATKRIYTKDSGGNVVELGTNAASSTIDQLTVVTSTTLSYGTANQVQYLNASKLLVGSVNMTFNGTTLALAGLSNSGTTTLTGTATLSGLTASTALALDASKNVVSVTNTGTGDNVLATSPTLVTPALGTPASGVVTNLTGTASININGTVGATTPAVATVTTLTATADSAFTSTGSVTIAKGTTGERPGSPVAGMFRFNTTTAEFEGYNGAAFASVGGAALSNDTSTATNVFPLFANATTGTASSLFTSNAKLLYKPSTGELQATAMVSSNGITVNANTIAADYTIAATNNGMSAGPVTVNSGITVTVSSGSTWVVV
jgi:hypothetical protein